MEFFSDRKIECVDCGEMFVFPAGAQSFYKKKGFTDPKRCKDCRRIQKEKRERE